MQKTIIGFYGKIPSHRDFVHSNLPRAFIDSWDPWLQDMISFWRKELTQDDWMADYLTMNPYRFVLSSGIAGEVNWLGVMVPSRDHVGRLFPLTVAIPIPSTISPITIQKNHDSWLDKIETIAINCLLPDFKPELIHTDFMNNLITQGLPNLSAHSDMAHIQSSELLHSISCAQDVENNTSYLQKQYSFALNQSEGSLLALTESLLREYCHSYSLWWSKESDHVLYSQGLPNKHISPAFIDKQWEKWGWLTNKNNSNSQTQNEDDTRTF